MLSAELIALCQHAHDSVEELAFKYHDGGLWGLYLNGYCGIASRFLVNLAKRNGIFDMRLVCGGFCDLTVNEEDQIVTTHCWIEYNGFCIDLTISQFDSFNTKKISICSIGDEFYNSHYIPELIGSRAVKNQRTWTLGQNYESCSKYLWRIHHKKYPREYNGIFLIPLK